MSIFDNLGSADPTQGRAPFITPGTYLCTSDKLRGGSNRKKKNFFAGDFTLDDTLAAWDHTGDEQSAPDATLTRGRFCYYVNLSSDWPELALGNVKSLLVALLGLDDATVANLDANLVPDANGELVEYDGNVWADYAEQAIEGEGDLLAGVHLICYAENRPTQKGNPFTVCTWERVDDERFAAMKAEIAAEPEPEPAARRPVAAGAAKPTLPGMSRVAADEPKAAPVAKPRLPLPTRR